MGPEAGVSEHRCLTTNNYLGMGSCQIELD